MQLSRATEKQPLGIIFDSDMTGIDDVLALALMFGFDGKREARMVSLSVSRPSIHAAAYCDAVSRFYAGAAAQFMRMLPVGMQLAGEKPGPEPFLDGPAAKPDYKSTIEKLNDTADPAAVIRNALTSQSDNNCTIVLSGPATSLAQAYKLPGVPELVARKIKLFTFLQPDTADPALVKLLADWPTPVVAVTPEIGAQIQYPATSIETDYAWSKAHPIVDSYRAYKPMPYDAPTGTMAAILYTVRPQEGYFKLSDPGTFGVQDGKLKLMPSAQGKHRQLLLDPQQKDRILKVYTEVSSAKPVPRFPRFRQMMEEEKKDDEKDEKKAPDAAKPKA